MLPCCHLHHGIFASQYGYAMAQKTVLACFPKSSMRGVEGGKGVAEHHQINLTGLGEAYGSKGAFSQVLRLFTETFNQSSW
jgi:hypothetical protein